MSLLLCEERDYLNDKKITFQEVEDGNHKGIILQDYRLPDGLYDQNATNVLILLPSGYPDIPPDMFHTLPWVRLVSNNQYPNRADHPVTFAGDRWQRWSRHSDDWRQGVDGIRTVLRRIDNAFRVAA